MGDTTGQLLEIRPFRESDEASVVALWHAVFPDDPPWNEPTLVVQRKLAVQRDLFLVAIRRDRLVGTALAGFDGFRGWVYHLAITPDERGHGFGRSLMGEVEDRLRALGCPKLNLQVRAANHGVVAFYRDLGYSVEERVSMGKRLV
jgi:ribosomal protein S18 acetylase RimI-like enzyme